MNFQYWKTLLHVQNSSVYIQDGNPSMNNRLSKEFDIKNFHNDIKNRTDRIMINNMFIVDKDVKNSLISRINVCFGGYRCRNGFYYHLLFKITDIPSDDLNKYIYFDPIKRELSKKIVAGKKLYLNMYVQVYKPFNHNKIFTNEYFFNYTAIDIHKGKRL